MPSSSTQHHGRHWVESFDGSRLTAHRKSLGWTQVRLAEAIYDLHADHTASPTDAARRIRTLVVQVSCYESGRTRPRGRAIRDLAAALKVDVQDLLVDDTPLTLPSLRARLGLTQADVAANLPGMSRGLYAHVEQGRRTLSQAETATLAKVLQVDLPTISRMAPSGERRPSLDSHDKPPYSTDPAAWPLAPA